MNIIIITAIAPPFPMIAIAPNGIANPLVSWASVILLG